MKASAGLFALDVHVAIFGGMKRHLVTVRGGIGRFDGVDFAVEWPFGWVSEPEAVQVDQP